MGRVKIYVPGIYPIQFKDKHQLLPWAQPAMSLFGGGWKNQLNPKVDKIQSIDKSLYNQTQDKASIQSKNNKDLSKKTVTSNPASLFDPLKIGATVETQVIQGKPSDTRTQIQNIKGKGPKDQKQGGTGQGNGSGGGANQIHQLNSQTGWCSIPQAGYAATDGSQVFLFFQADDINKPVYFAVAQSGQGWFSEHHNQHVFMTNNMRVRIDEDTKRPQSTVKFNTYNSDCVKQYVQLQPAWTPKTFVQQPNVVIDQIPKTHTPVNHRTKIDMEIYAADDEQTAVDLKVTGRVNIKVIGDIYLQHIGNKYQTHVGDHFLHHQGNTYIQQQGKTSIVTIGDILTHRTGNVQHTLIGNHRKHHTGDQFHYQTGNIKQYIYVVKTILNSITSENIQNMIINDKNIINTITNNNNIVNTITNNNNIVFTVTNVNAFIKTINNTNSITINVTDGASIKTSYSAPLYDKTVTAPTVNKTINATVFNKTVNAALWNITSKVVQWTLSLLNFK